MPMQTPSQPCPPEQCQLPMQDVPNVPFLLLCHPELPINPEQGTAWPGSPSTAVPNGAFQLCCFQTGRIFSQLLNGCSPHCPRGMHCHPIDGHTTLEAAGGPGMQENQCHLTRMSGLCALLGTPRQGSGMFADSRHSLQAVLPPHFLG